MYFGDHFSPLSYYVTKDDTLKCVFFGFITSKKLTDCYETSFKVTARFMSQLYVFSFIL